MSEYFFGPFNGHLSSALRKAIEAKFPDVSVVNHTEPRGEKRGWFSGPNRGEPFDSAMAGEVLAFARQRAKGRDAQLLGPMLASAEQMRAIEWRTVDATAREMARRGVELSHEQADRLDGESLTWLEKRLGLRCVQTDRGIKCTPKVSR